MLGAIEAGGTKFVCAVGDGDGNVLERVQFPTTIPEETMANVIGFFKKYPISAIGVGSFGPIDVDKKSPTYGNITSTPKLAWKDYPFLKSLEEVFQVPIGFNTDVNVAALGEATIGAAEGLESCLYITIGTGVGAGAVVNGKLLQGHSHPEMGHILVNRHPDDLFSGICPYHKDCFEGLASGPSIEKRWGRKGIELTGNADVWKLEGFYIAQALMNYILIISPKKIILGGGVMKQNQIFKYINDNLSVLMNDYVSVPDFENYIVSPKLGDSAGVVGALILARQTLEDLNIKT